MILKYNEQYDIFYIKKINNLRECISNSYGIPIKNQDYFYFIYMMNNNILIDEKYQNYKI